MLKHVVNIWRKEITDSSRDRRALIQSIAIPLIVGICYAVMNPMMNAVIARRAREPFTMPAKGIEHAGDELLGVLREHDITLERFEGDLEQFIRHGEKPAGLLIPAGFAERIRAEHPQSLVVLSNPTAGGLFGPRISSDRLELAVEDFNRRVANSRARTHGIDPAILVPVELTPRNLATPAQLAGLFASFTLPILLAMIVTQGGLFVAIDVTAGEKERGTLEALLVTPASDLEVFVGKLAAVFTMTCIPTALTFLGFYASSNMLPATITKGAVLPFKVIAGAILVGLPLALFLNAMLMIVSIRTKTFKDAQSLATPIILAVIAPAMAAAFSPPATSVAFLIPVYGPAAAVGAMATGSPMPAHALLLSTIGSLAAAVITAVIALRFFDRERLLYAA